VCRANSSSIPSHLLTPHQGTTTTSFTFPEEGAPLNIAANFNLIDFDSPDITSSSLTLTLTGAVDEEWEGLMVETGGTGVEVSQIQGVPQYTQRYNLTGGTSFSEYQEVRD